MIDIETNNIFISRDVIFHEDIFPFKQSSFSSHTNPFQYHVLHKPLPAIPFSTHSSPSINVNPDPILHDQPNVDPNVQNVSHRPQRQRVRPTYLRDVHCNLINSVQEEKLPQYPLSAVLSYNQLSSSHKAYTYILSTQHEPSSFKEAVQQIEWKQAMDEKLQALELNNTWTIVPLPLDRKPLGCKWVFKLKRKADGSIERYKARLVPKGYNQQEGVDF